ncbi:collectin-11-like [Corticium candelabrum]|nr:collectin-11-like [Corticium candelabrum]
MVAAYLVKTAFFIVLALSDAVGVDLLNLDTCPTSCKEWVNGIAPYLKGQKGDVGRPGNPGIPGEQGAGGPPGRAGSPGDPGISGNDGHPGFPGQPGRAGLPGSRGDMGRRGPTGEKGQKGKTGDIFLEFPTCRHDQYLSYDGNAIECIPITDYLPAQHQSKCDCKCDCLSKEEIAFVRRLMAQEKGKPDEKGTVSFPPTKPTYSRNGRGSAKPVLSGRSKASASASFVSGTIASRIGTNEVVSATEPGYVSKVKEETPDPYTPSCPHLYAPTSGALICLEMMKKGYLIVCDVLCEAPSHVFSEVPSNPYFCGANTHYSWYSDWSSPKLALRVPVCQASTSQTSRLIVSPDYYYRKSCSSYKRRDISSMASDFHWRLLQIGLCDKSRSCNISKVQLICSTQ